jgi:hypothetical protein
VFALAHRVGRTIGRFRFEEIFKANGVSGTFVLFDREADTMLSGTSPGRRFASLHIQDRELLISLMSAGEDVDEVFAVWGQAAVDQAWGRT